MENIRQQDSSDTIPQGADPTTGLKYYEYTDKKALTKLLLATSVREIEVELSTYTKAQLTATYRTVYETNPLTSFSKAKIAQMIVMYRLDMHRTEVLLGKYGYNR